MHQIVGRGRRSCSTPLKTERLDRAIERESANRRDAVAIDPHRAFCGPNAGYYDERWRWMAWKGVASSWNGAAAAAGPAWLGYRKLYGAALAACSLEAALVALVLSFRSPAVWLIAAAAAPTARAAIAWRGNALLERRFKRIYAEARREASTALAREQTLIEKGGVDRLAASLFASIGVALLALLAIRALGFVSA